MILLPQLAHTIVKHKRVIKPFFDFSRKVGVARKKPLKIKVFSKRFNYCAHRWLLNCQKDRSKILRILFSPGGIGPNRRPMELYSGSSQKTDRKVR